MPDPASELRDQVDAAHAAAERLVREAQERAAEAERASREQNRDVPPSGWAAPGADGDALRLPELHTIMALLEAARGAIPTELTVQLAEALRDLLVALRALLDWYIERLEAGPERRGRGAAPVEDIPIVD